MEEFVKGEVVVIKFPFTDLTGFSKRPALVLANLKGHDLILCQITTQQKFDDYVIELNSKHFFEGNLIHPSFIRVNKLFTASKKIILKKVGIINKNKFLEVKNKLFEII